MNVLIADDDALTRLMLQRAVEHQGHACLVAQDGLEAWQLFQAHRVDHRTTMRAAGQGHALLVATRALARSAFPSGMHAGVPCEVLLWG
jgi:DNA-binding response OmpR family regulator